MSAQWINVHALRWAIAQDGLDGTAKYVLLVFAIHADERGYTWPSIDHIASTYGLHRETVRRQIALLLVRRKLSRTRKRIGSTGQVAVYRLPKSAREVAYRAALQKDQSGLQVADKRRTSGVPVYPNNDNDNNHQHHPDTTLSLESTTGAPNQPNGKSVLVGKEYQYHAIAKIDPDMRAQAHVKWPEFANWCIKKGGQPHEAGFWKWMCGQKLQWRNRQSPKDIEGYVRHGKFYPGPEACALQAAHPEWLDDFHKAIKRNGRIQLL